MPSPLPQPPRKVKPRAPTPTTPVQSRKRPAPDDVEEVEPSAKRSKIVVGNAGVTDAVPFTPSKKRRLEEDGLIMLDSAEEKIEEDADPDVIEID